MAGLQMASYIITAQKSNTRLFDNSRRYFDTINFSVESNVLPAVTSK